MKKYWVSLEEWEGEGKTSSDSRAKPGAGETPLLRDSEVRSPLNNLSSLDRRAFLKMVGFSLAVGALAGCRKPVEKIIPYLNHPPELTPGVASWYATTCYGCSAGCGVLAKVLDGRPIKFEGNPDHRMSRGGLCAVGQGAILGLYDSSRQKVPTIEGKKVGWDPVDREVRQALTAARQEGKKVVLLSSTLTGPATLALIQEFLQAFPRSEHLFYDPVPYDALREACRLAYGKEVIPGYRFDKARVIVSFGADFLGTWLSPVEFTKQYSSGRDLVSYSLEKGFHQPTDPPAPPMSQHIQFEAGLSLTGSNADYRYPIAPSEQGLYITALTIGVAKALAQTHPKARALAQMPLPQLPEEAEISLRKTTEALLKARGQSLIVSNSNEVSVQLAVLTLNELLGNLGKTLDLSRPSYQKKGDSANLLRLLEEMQRGEVGVLLIHQCNPAYTFPEAEEFLQGLQKVPCSLSFAWMPDETSRAVKVHCPTHHPIESWGDAEPQAGRYSLFQPTIRPLYQTRQFEDSLLKWHFSLQGKNKSSFYHYLRAYWEKSIFPRQSQFADFPSFWDHVLQQGFFEVPISSSPLPSFRWGEALRGVKNLLARLQRKQKTSLPITQLEVEVFEPVALREGSLANNPWLQELPDPITKITWDNYASISPTLAQELKIQEGQLIQIQVDDRTLTLPAHIQPGQHRRTISIPLGYGRTHTGPIGKGVGVNAYPLMTYQEGRLKTTGFVASLKPLEQVVSFAQTQLHSSLEGRPIVLETLYSQFLQGDFEKGHREEGEEVNLWGEHQYPEYRWGMVVDLTRCIGCSACVVACDLENNVPVVGREEVRRQREMHWLRLDRYFSGDPEKPEVVHQPMMCQQCDHASCETVCPALATVHDDQGINVQVYNRCVGTRYCANNCPYKVRRFNFFNNISNDLTRNLALNPDVTVRSRGVMEKCSFCLQRIQSARIQARKEGRKVYDGEIQTACSQSCPADAIVFGNLADPQSKVSRLSALPHSYRVLEELNRRPKVYYLMKVRHRDEEEVRNG